MYENMSIMEMENDIQAKINGIYEEMRSYKEANPVLPEGTILDEDQSVRWNREEVQRRNNSRKGKLSAFQRQFNDLHREGDAEIKRRISEEYSFGDAITAIVFACAYEDGHSGGLCEIWSFAQKYASFASDVLDAANN